MTRSQRLVFGEVAQQYDEARPSYPAEVFDFVMSHGALMVGDDALEIGAGTGKATEKFIARGLQVHALEPSAGMAEVLCRKGLDVEETTFEDWPLQEGAYRLVYAAQAWHWVGGEDRYEKVGRALAPGGIVALFWNRGRDHPEPFKGDNDDVYRRLWPEADCITNPFGGWDRETLVGDFEACGLFEPMVEHVVTWATSYTADEWIRLLGTHSNHRMLPDDARTKLHAEVGAAIDAHGGVLECVYDTLVFVSRRV
jgi:SAM-dependent methyltransferase